MDEQTLIELTADIVISHVTNNSVDAADLPRLLQTVHSALAELGKSIPVEPEARQPIVSVRSSVKPDFIVCLVCGQKNRTLKRHLGTAHGMTPEQYRSEYGLPSSYPMAAPSYAEMRRTMAKTLGLGRKKGEKAGPRANAKSPKTGGTPSASKARATASPAVVLPAPAKARRTRKRAEANTTASVPANVKTAKGEAAAAAQRVTRKPRASKKVTEQAKQSA